MKRIKDFIYCDSVLTTRTVFYLVAVGSSKRDSAAWRYIRQVAKGNNYFTGEHGIHSQQFIEACATSIYDGVPSTKAVKLLRRVLVPVTWLARFLRENPHCLLNSGKIAIPENKKI